MPDHAISVLVAAYNAERYVAQCLDSVLNQTITPHEIIVIDDGSTDNTPAILRTYANRIRLVSRANRGVARTLNEAVGLSVSPLLAFVDADDYWEPDKLARQLARLREQPPVEACFGYVRQFVSPELPAAVRLTIACDDQPQPGWHKSTLLIRRSAMSRTGLFDPDAAVDFIEWFGRARDAGLRYAMLPDLLAHRRLHRSGLASQQNYNRQLAETLRATLARRNAV